MKMKSSILAAAIFGAATFAGAATSIYTFTTSTGDNYVNVWNALQQEPNQYGSFTGNNAYNIWCDTMNIVANSLAVNLDLANFSQGYPLSQGIVNLTLLGSNFNAILNNQNATSTANFGVKNGATMTITGGANFNTGGQLSMNENSAGTVIVNGDSTFYNANTTLGSASATTLQKVAIEGSGNTVTFRNFRLVGGAGTTADNVLGGLVEFVADANGLTTVSVVGGNQSFSGSVAVDFTNLLWDESWGEEKTFTLFSLSDNMADFATWVDNDDLKIIKGASDATFTSDARHLYVTVAKSAIPEPSTYAAIFGALAIAFALMRRRVRK